MNQPDEIQFFVAGLPQPKGSARAFVPKGWSRPVVTQDNPKSRPWERTIAAMAQQHQRADAPWSGPIGLELAFVLQKPKSAPKSRPIFPITRPDLDKLTRALKDALRAVLYRDDAQVTFLLATKQYGEMPGVRVTLWRRSEPGELHVHETAAHLRAVSARDQ